MEAHMNFLYVLAWPLGYVMELIYNKIGKSTRLNSSH